MPAATLGLMGEEKLTVTVPLDWLMDETVTYGAPKIAGAVATVPEELAALIPPYISKAAS